MKNQLETWERWLSKLTILCIIIATAPAPLLAASQQGSVTIAVQWGANSPLFQGLRSAIELFEKRYPGTQVETLSGYGVDKLNVAVAGGTPPDAYQVGAQWVIPYGVTGVLQPLNEHIARSGIKLESDFIPPMVAQSRWRGQVYAIPLSADINFALFRNVDILDAAGVDAQREITFFDELQAIIRKVTRYDADGSIVQAGYVPWPSGDMSNDLLTWGLAFGGSFYDPQTLVLRSSDAANVEALEWLREEQARIGGKAGLTRLQAGLRGGFHRVSNNNIAFSLMYPNPILHIVLCQL